MTAGHQADGAFWYGTRDGVFNTSSYYASHQRYRMPEDLEEGETPDQLASWFVTFHERQLLESLFGQTWEPLLSLAEAERFGIEPVDWGFRERSFPYTFGGPALEAGGGFYAGIYASPYVDDYVVQFSKALIAGEDLGEDDIPDFIGVTLSAVDAVGHTYGPDSPELLDAVMRVDRSLGDLLDFVDDKIGLDQVAISLSADHGVGTIPELAAQRGEGGGRFGTEQVLCFQRLGQQLSQRYGSTTDIWLEDFYLDHDKALELGLDSHAFARELAAGLEACPSIARVLYSEDLLAEQEPDDIEQLFLNSFHPRRSPDLMVHLEPNTLAGSTTASHGSAHRYDTHVPWLLRVPGAAARRIEQRTNTIDVAPTLAPLLGLGGEGSPAERFDGVDRTPLLTSVLDDEAGDTRLASLQGV